MQPAARRPLPSLHRPPLARALTCAQVGLTPARPPGESAELVAARKLLEPVAERLSLIFGFQTSQPDETLRPIAGNDGTSSGGSASAMGAASSPPSSEGGPQLASAPETQHTSHEVNRALAPTRLPLATRSQP